MPSGQVQYPGDTPGQDEEAASYQTQIQGPAYPEIEPALENGTDMPGLTAGYLPVFRKSDQPQPHGKEPGGDKTY